MKRPKRAIKEAWKDVSNWLMIFLIVFGSLLSSTENQTGLIAVIFWTILQSIFLIIMLLVFAFIVRLISGLFQKNEKAE